MSLKFNRKKMVTTALPFAVATGVATLAEAAEIQLTVTGTAQQGVSGTPLAFGDTVVWTGVFDTDIALDGNSDPTEGNYAGVLTSGHLNVGGDMFADVNDASEFVRNSPVLSDALTISSGAGSFSNLVNFDTLPLQGFDVRLFDSSQAAIISDVLEDALLAAPNFNFNHPASGMFLKTTGGTEIQIKIENVVVENVPEPAVMIYIGGTLAALALRKRGRSPIQVVRDSWGPPQP